MSSALHTIGGFNEKELMAVDYAETPESGTGGITRKYKPELYGWMRETSVNIIVSCWKKDIDDVLDAFPASPTNLTSNPGKNADGSTPARLQWGSGFTLQKVSPRMQSPSIVQLHALYTREIAEAQDAYPTNLTVTCASGVYTVKWKGLTLKMLDNGTGSCGSAGLEFVKMPQRKDTVLITTIEDGTVYQETVYYYINPLEIRVDGVKVESNEVLDRSESIVPKKAQGNGPAKKETTGTEPLSDDYAADLHWYTDGDICRLIWCDQVVWNFEA
jgi:hypothetical protein